LDRLKKRDLLRPNLPNYRIDADGKAGLRLGVIRCIKALLRSSFFFHPQTRASVDFLKAAEAAAPSFKAEVTALSVHNADEIARAVSVFAAEPRRGLIVLPHAVTLVNGDLIIEVSARYRLPAIRGRAGTCSTTGAESAAATFSLQRGLYAGFMTS
jgi:hypothetical protein